MHISYDYSALIRELQEELDDGILTPESTIYVLRENITRTVRIPGAGERIIALMAIVDWYYGNENQPGEWDDYKEEEARKEYERVKDLLEEISVSDCIEEMKTMSAPL